jgi:hypothetical protein
MGDLTRSAMRAFLDLPDDASVQNDAEFRRRLFATYFTEAKQDIDLAPERFVDPGYMGCGEFNPVEAVSGAHEPNRRVHVFFFHPDAVPELPCRYNDVGPCRDQIADPTPRHRASHRCAFYDGLTVDCTCGETARTLVEIRLYDHARQYIADAPYRISVDGEVVASGTANKHGFVRRLDIPTPGRCVVEWSAITGEPKDGREPLLEHELELYLTEGAGLDAEEAAVQHLHNLGYPDELDRSTRVQWFQLDYHDRFELEITGQLDAATIAAIEEVHDTVQPVLVES